MKKQKKSVGGKLFMEPFPQILVCKGKATYFTGYGFCLCYHNSMNVCVCLPSHRWLFAVLEMRCYRKILCISYKHYVTNEEVHTKIQHAGNQTTWRLDHHKEMRTAAVWSCLLFITSSQNHLARHSGRAKKTRQTEEEVGRQQQGMDRPGVRQVSEGSGEQRKMEETACEVICGDPTTSPVKG